MTDRLRHVRRDDYPELAGYSVEQIYEDSIGPGGLYLAARMARALALRPGDLVLDLGCGRGASSLYLAREFGARVVAVDLWTPAEFLAEKFAARGYRDRILPLHLDASKPLPFAERYFDALFTMNSFSFYGGSVAEVQRFARLVRPGGLFVLGSETLSDEFTPEQLAHPPAVYDYAIHTPGGPVRVWADDFLKLHSPRWWGDLFRAAGLEVLNCAELPDGVILLEDQVAHELATGADPEDTAHSLAQLAWGEAHRPYKTVFLLAAWVGE